MHPHTKLTTCRHQQIQQICHCAKSLKISCVSILSQLCFDLMSDAEKDGFSPGLRRPTPTATAPSDIFTTNRRQAVRARRCIFSSWVDFCLLSADVVRLRLGLILSVGRRAYRLYGVSAGQTQAGILNAAPGFLLIDTQGNSRRKC